MQTVPLTFDSPAALVVGLLIAALGVGVAVYRNPAAPALTKVLGAVGLLLLAAAAGGPAWRRDEPREVVVMVDLSPSTRTAQYRDPAALRARVRQLLGDAPHSISYFADGAVDIARHADGTPRPDAAAARTTFVPPSVDAVLLFSDARFELPAVAPPTYVVVDPALQDPPDAAAYLLPSIIVLDNVAASDVGGVQQQRLRQYVRDLGGGLVILGGDRAFAAGGYAGSALDALSPLASHPPEPATHWVFLVDSSGSMNAPAGGAGGTRWQAATAAVAAALPALPPQDVVSVGGFAAAVDWWVRGTPAEAARAGGLPPPGARASGPTELRAALESAASGAAQGPRVEVLVLTDANAPVERPADLAAVMTRSNVRLHLLDIGDAAGAGLPGLRQVVAETGGTLLREAEPGGWGAAVRRLARAASPDLLVREPAPVEFVGPLAGTPPRMAAPPWNRAWVKPGASEAARTTAGGRAVAAAWAAGEGRVLSAAFGATPADAEVFARHVARPPRDPRLRVTWDAGAKLRVAVDAVDADASPGEPALSNGLPLTLELVAAGAATGGGATPRRLTVPQVAPGRYELLIDPPAVPSIAVLRADGRAVDRAAVAGRYAPEFDRVGNDRAAMRDLAARSGGSVIEPSDTRPLRLTSPERATPLTPPVAAAAAACVAAALVRWRFG